MRHTLERESDARGPTPRPPASQGLQADVITYCVVAMPFSIVAMSLLNSTTTAALTSAVPDDSRGFILGAAGAAEAITRALAPQIAAFLLQYEGGPASAATAFCVLAMFPAVGCPR